ncbi:MAG: DUF1015 family protein, partial [Candidatus Omnitrophota bacterium]
SVTDDKKTVHKLWKLQDPEILASIEAKMRNENIFIADGHHRYEVALAYREEMRRNSGRISGEEDFNYVLCYFTNVKSRGLSILPIHRLVKTGEDFDMGGFLFKLKDYFDVERVKDKARFFFLLEKGGQTEHLLGMYRCKEYSLIRLKNVLIPDVKLKDKPKEYRSLDVSILNSLILDKILKAGMSDKDNVTFSPCTQELIEKADTDSAYIAFFLNSVKVEQILNLALKGEKMPPKTTYFYPKVLSGLVINKFNEGKS